MGLDLFAGLPVGDYAGALDWYGKLFGGPPSFVVSDTEAVWELADHRSVYVEHLPGRAGGAMVTLFVDDLDERVTAASARGVEPSSRETYANGVRKVVYVDPDGNEIGFGGAPVAV
ncbi:VOC family protein [Saccharothrix violaceirubra]|uniref:Catechol 2,3-dioxygenase-like lactoylglutathione lyase family enzyme n=1 Tax=Saccharothrix violaceirubra TaxID=413306 RepID=A0A7W7WV17_9PSEU|nr:VOC family protein [Saccharothrix violaceirubra]MBB4964651.1 catechol 2,3-dioxygenase-like lactoylglutathione lyase family enzyme [Saccharothrix violaceirubra]